MIYQIKEDAYGSKDIPVHYTTAHPRCAYYSVGKRVLIKSYTKVVHRVRSSVNVLVIESLSLEWFHGNCLFFFGCSIPFLFFPMKHKWTTKQTSKTKNAQKLRRCELGYCLVSVLKCAGHELRINWPQQKKTDNYTYLRWNSWAIQDRFSPIDFDCRQSKFNRNLSKDTFCANFFFKTLLVKKILPWTTKEL